MEKVSTNKTRYSQDKARHSQLTINGKDLIKTQTIAALNNINSYSNLQKYCEDNEVIYRKLISYNGETANHLIIKKGYLKQIINVVVKLKRDDEATKELIEDLFVTTSTYGKPFEITVAAYSKALKIYPIECLKQVLDCTKYKEFPTLNRILESIEVLYPLAEMATNPNKQLFIDESTLTLNDGS